MGERECHCDVLYNTPISSRQTPTEGPTLRVAGSRNSIAEARRVTILGQRTSLKFFWPASIWILVRIWVVRETRLHLPNILQAGSRSKELCPTRGMSGSPWYVQLPMARDLYVEVVLVGQRNHDDEWCERRLGSWVLAGTVVPGLCVEMTSSASDETTSPSYILQDLTRMLS
ncbi:hypothetical protein JAAARDRAFT_422432 [Jaapia argillacea MUCL 33604]|uniref:Uncharacterized protein n=1 Tax=Jaapia argillacea MUCL 33604 TaxID=933084 RepID=A0A067PTU2_9AGAM|nr:hypothetical protein JAAARDRAFT_422432 [Jaapia argillacea MUCL 33604]